MTETEENVVEDRLDFDTIEKQLDSMIESEQLPSADAIDEWVEEKAAQKGRKSKLTVRRSMRDLAYSGLYFQYISDAAGRQDRVPKYGSLDRDHYLSKIWQGEPILAGAVYSMSAKMVSLKWQVSGRRNLAIYYAKLYSRSAYMGGYGWGGFSSSSATDFYTTDRGVFWEEARVGNPMYGKLADIGHIDSLQCTLTGNTRRPVHYVSELTGQNIRFRPGEIAHFSSMNSPREEHLGMGFCAVSRALRAAKLLIGLHDYDAEKLANLPPEGVAAVTGLTVDEFHDALALWRSGRAKDDSLTFPQVLWLIGSQPNVKVTVDFVGFSQLPESFDRQTVIQQYINTLALCFGVDTREFWAISSGALGTASETEVQHMKAKGKGHGEYIALTERILNDEMPDGVEFGYDTQDIEEDETAARVAKAWVDAFLPLTVAGGAAEAVIDNEMLLRLLADKNVIPDWMVQDDRVVADDMGVHEKDFSHDDVIVIEWDGRILKQKYSPSIDLSYRVVGRKQKKLLPDALDITPPTELKTWQYKGGAGSGHRGHAGRPGKRGGSLAGVGGLADVENIDVGFLTKYAEYIQPRSLTYPNLVRDIAKHGIKTPVTLSISPDGKFALLTQGNHRLAAARELGIDKVPVELRVHYTVSKDYNMHVKRLRKADLNELMGIFGENIIIKKEYHGDNGDSSWESTDAAVEFLKQAEATLEEEPERNIRGNPIPEDESLRGADVTQTAIDHELELWRSHPMLSQYLPEGEVKLG